MIDDVRTFGLKDRSDPAVTTAFLLRAVNWAYRHVTHPRIHGFREMQAESNIVMATGDNDYTINVLGGINVVAVQSIYHAIATAITPLVQKRKLKPKSKQYFDARTLFSSPPVNYMIWGDLLFIIGVPRVQENGQLLRVSYWREPAALTVGTATIIPDYWDEVIIFGATAFAQTKLDYGEKAENSRQAYAALINDLTPRSELEADDQGWEVELISEPVMGPV